MRIAIVPARGGSKRIPHKNIIDFHGKPMICHILEQISTSKIFDEIHVSTDDEEIVRIVEKAGYSAPFLRPSHLADDFTPVLDVARYVLSEYKKQGKEFESFALVMPCSPLILAEDFKGAYKTFEERGADLPVLAVAKFPTPIEWAFKDVNGILESADHQKMQMRSQDIQPSYYDSGTFSIQSSNRVLGSQVALSSQFLKYEIPAWRAVDIDEKEDLETARMMFKLLTNRE